jgi:hypothetical protein
MEQPDMSDRLRAAFNELISCQDPPSIDAVLALGKELANAHLDEFIYEAIGNESIARGILRGMLYAATRLHLPGRTREERDRVNDRGHVRGKLVDIAANHRWPAIHSEVVKFSSRVYAEVAARTPSSSPKDNIAARGAPRKNAEAVDYAIALREENPRPSWKAVWGACKTILQDTSQTAANFKHAVLEEEKRRRLRHHDLSD